MKWAGRKWVMFAVALAIGAQVWGEARVENVRAQQRARSRVVDVWYDLVAPEGGVYEVSLAIGGDGMEPPLSTVGGDIGADIEPGRNKRIEWDAGADWPGRVGSNFVATVTAVKMEEEDTGPSKGMVRIPGGTNSGNDPDFGEYSLTVESFYMDKTEVTYAHWKRVYNWAVAHGYKFDNAGSGKGANHPVHSVNRFDCMKWCNARSEMESLSPAYCVGGAVYRTGRSYPKGDPNSQGYRLPTKIEWEYAARGGLRGCRFPWGNTICHEKANYRGESKSYVYDTSYGYHPQYYVGRKEPFSAPVGSFAANAYGLYDMAGNVQEYVEYAQDTTGYMNGCYSSGPQCCRCRQAWQITYFDLTSKSEGFRCVRRR